MHIYNWTKWAQDRLVLPMVFGHEFSGDIVEAGSAVKALKLGTGLQVKLIFHVTNAINARPVTNIYAKT